MRLFFLVMFVLTTMGCVAVSDSLKRFEACKSDSVCYERMLSVENKTHVMTEAAVSAVGFPTVPEAAAVLVSGVAAFIYGVRHGKKKGG